MSNRFLYVNWHWGVSFVIIQNCVLVLNLNLRRGNRVCVPICVFVMDEGCSFTSLYGCHTSHQFTVDGGEPVRVVLSANR
jgi:hypothetical protein